MWYFIYNCFFLLLGGAAERAGLHAGDKIIKVNGVNVMQSTHTQVVALIKCKSVSICWISHFRFVCKIFLFNFNLSFSITISTYLFFIVNKDVVVTRQNSFITSEAGISEATTQQNNSWNILGVEKALEVHVCLFGIENMSSSRDAVFTSIIFANLCPFIGLFSLGNR